MLGPGLRHDAQGRARGAHVHRALRLRRARVAAQDPRRRDAALRRGTARLRQGRALGTPPLGPAAAATRGPCAPRGERAADSPTLLTFAVSAGSQRLGAVRLARPRMSHSRQLAHGNSPTQTRQACLKHGSSPTSLSGRASPPLCRSALFRRPRRVWAADGSLAVVVGGLSSAGP